MLCKIHGTENQVVMHMTFVNMGSQYIFIFTAKDAVGKLPPDLMGCFRRNLARFKCLYQVMGKVIALIHCPQPRFLKLNVCGFRRAAERGYIEFALCLCRVGNVVKGFLQGAFDRMDLCDSHISFSPPFMSSMSCA